MQLSSLWQTRPLKNNQWPEQKNNFKNAHSASKTLKPGLKGQLNGSRLAQQVSHPALPTRKAREITPIQNRATIEQIMAKNPNGDFQNVLFQPNQRVYFQIDPNETRLVTPEEFATNSRNAGKAFKRDGHHQIVFTTSFPGKEAHEEGPFLVKLKGPIVWPPHLNIQGVRIKQPNPGFLQEWRALMKKFNIHTKDISIGNVKPLPKPMDIVVQFNKLTPEGYTDDLDIFPTEKLPELWAQHIKEMKLKID